MARTTITAQKLQTLAGQAISFQALDSANGMQVKNTGIQVVLVKTEAGAAATLSFPTQADAFNRTAPVPQGNVGASEVRAFGPFTTPSIWGDAATLLFIDASGVSGSAQVAVITI
jgi:hypothetical protein